MLDATIAEQLRERGHDVTAVQGDPELESKKDPELLRAARERNRVLVTDNIVDFARLHQEFVRAREDHGGILLASPSSFPRSKRTIGVWVRALDRLLMDESAADLRNLCSWIAPDR